MKDLPTGMQADFGPCQINPALGVTLIGATPWITNFNVLVGCTRRVCRCRLSAEERHGGLDEKALARRTGLSQTGSLTFSLVLLWLRTQMAHNQRSVSL